MLLYAVFVILPIYTKVALLSREVTALKEDLVSLETQLQASEMDTEMLRARTAHLLEEHIRSHRN